MNKKVVIGLSGGVDSSIAAYVLKEQGYEVIGLFMKNWHDTTGVLKSDCPWLDDKFDAEAVARKLDIPFYMVDLSDQYRVRVVDYMFAEYEKGRTPNPDVLCNREIKFDVFMEEAIKLGADYVATGHYCRKETLDVNGKPFYRLLAGADHNKDQSYFLCQLSQQQLAKSLFPIGDLQKSEVRHIASKLNLITAHKKDSQGICFVGKVDLPLFLQQKLEAKEGKVFLIPSDSALYNKNEVDFDNRLMDDMKQLSKPIYYHPKYGKPIGTHNGAHFYTIGQRKGLNIGGFAEPLFVIGIDVKFNQVYVGMGQEHPGLYRSALKINLHETHWIRPDFKLEVGERRKYNVRIRYRQPLQKAEIFHQNDGLYILFDEPQRGITAGQFAAWYDDNDELIGSGVINA